MTKKYKLNKSELTRLKHEEKIYIQFLPVLKLKQEQLQIENIRIKKKYSILKNTYSEEKKLLEKKSIVLTDIQNNHNINDWVNPSKIIIKYKNLAGVSIPILDGIIFNKYFISFFDAPYWFSFIVQDIKQLIIKSIELEVINKQYFLIKKELKKATQKVNLFEKVLIPETKRAIKNINIILGDEQVASVGRSKIAKNKSTFIF